ncbi:MAG: lipid-A-disaccharide synthase [Thiohalophilus sp.]|uniref:lipid-A-disaccharide synthase n=1 Tax=Thiohalophilus sp. TaxID=3028392 RepID=UPI00286FBAEB|nr:lipid-A-disaccharide synthase [Thiohalophilus sp.]MDR9435292.1 lipid-A-disaccharide synthase [Thiohalophilus sp.]
MIIAGEASGDLHAAKLVEGVKQQRPDTRFFGIGGSAMRKAGVEILVESSELAVVGLIEVFAHRKVIFGALNQMREILRSDPPDLLILTDYPEFNLRLAQTAKECGVKVLYYISPQIWAWRQGRVKKIQRLVDKMAVVFPFEVDFYARHGVPVTYVGHPLAHEVKASADRDTLLHEFGMDPERPVVGLFPGSRRSEIKRLLPIIIDTARLLQQQRPQLQFVLPIASTLNPDLIRKNMPEHELDIHYIEQRPYDAMLASDAIITVSGTVTLEIALTGIPMVVINRVAWLTYHIVKRMLKIDHLALCNIVAQRRIVPELIQNDATPRAIAAELERILDDDDYRKEIKQGLEEVRQKLEDDSHITDIATVTVEMITD